MQLEGKWIVRISRDTTEVLEVVDGVLTTVKEPLKEDSKAMLIEMLGQGIAEEEITAVLLGRGELKETIEIEIKKLSH